MLGGVSEIKGSGDSFINQIGGNYNPYSKITDTTKNSFNEGFNLSSLEEEPEILPEEMENAKKKISKLHGKNFGRSLTLEMDADVLVSNSKFKMVVILLVVGCILFAVSSFKDEASAWFKEEPIKKPKKAKGRSKRR